MVVETQDIQADVATARIVAQIVAYAVREDWLDVRSDGRGTKQAALARQMAMYLTHTIFGFTYARVAVAFGRDRTTVSHACRVIEERRDNPAFDQFLEQLEEAVSQLNALPVASAKWSGESDFRPASGAMASW